MTDRILITGASGYIGRQLAARLAAADHDVVGLDIRVPSEPPCRIIECDIRDSQLAAICREHAVTRVVHLAAVLADSGDRARDYDIDVNGTRNVLEACVSAGVRQLIVTSSGAAYGYHADNPRWLDEDDALRGNPAFAYADHKRAVETLLAAYRVERPELAQLIFRPGTVLGAETDNQITRLFSGRRLLAIAGSDSPFVFIWDADVVDAIMRGIKTGASGIYNMAGDGALTIDEIAARLGKPVLRVPAALVKAGLWLGHGLRLTPHHPHQIDFLRYRPVLSNTRLKQEFGFTPAKTSAETFDYFVEHARRRGQL